MKFVETCSRCDGEGIVEREDVEILSDHDTSRGCDDCDGTGKVDCPACEDLGDDESQCADPDCWEGEVDCPACEGRGWTPETCGRCGVDLDDRNGTYERDSGEMTCSDCVPAEVDCPACDGTGEVTYAVPERVGLNLGPAPAPQGDAPLSAGDCACCGGRPDPEQRYAVLTLPTVDTDGVYYPRLCAFVSGPEGGWSAWGGCAEDVDRAPADDPRAERLGALLDLMPGEVHDGIVSEMEE